MSDTPTPPTTVEKTVVVEAKQLCRLWLFTYISIGLNVVILTCLLISCIMHHSSRHKHHGMGHRGGGGWGDRGGERGGGFGGHRFHHFGGMGGQGQGWGNRGGGGERGWGKSGGFGGQGPMDMGRGGMRGMGGPGMGGDRDRMRGGGFGMRGMMGGGPNQPPDPAKMTDMMVNQLTAKLTLTDDQKAKVKPIILDQVTQMQKDMEAQRAAMQKSMEDAKVKIRAILNADQQKQLDAIQLPGQKSAAASAPATPAAK